MKLLKITSLCLLAGALDLSTSGCAMPHADEEAVEQESQASIREQWAGKLKRAVHACKIWNRARWPRTGRTQDANAHNGTEVFQGGEAISGPGLGTDNHYGDDPHGQDVDAFGEGINRAQEDQNHAALMVHPGFGASRDLTGPGGWFPGADLEYASGFGPGPALSDGCRGGWPLHVVGYRGAWKGEGSADSHFDDVAEYAGKIKQECHRRCWEKYEGKPEALKACLDACFSNWGWRGEPGRSGDYSLYYSE